jgi:hypothetical protein
LRSGADYHAQIPYLAAGTERVLVHHALGARALVGLTSGEEGLTVGVTVSAMY